MAVGRDTTFADLLTFYAEAGVDDALEEEPVDRFAEVAAAARATAKRRQPRRPSDGPTAAAPAAPTS